MPEVTTRSIIEAASQHLLKLRSHTFDVLDITKPVTPAAAVNLSQVISKLSPLLGNMIEFNTVEFLNAKPEFNNFGKWRRQDPGFPDTVFDGGILPLPGFEIKAWFPLATEITARFKDSQNHFLQDNTHVAMLAWLPEHLIFGKPYILDVVVVSGASVAKARDEHYHNPPDYLVLEPEDTSARAVNLQQTNTSGYKWQGTDAELTEAHKIVDAWGMENRKYRATAEYQTLLRQLTKRYKYRLDTNYAKMDRIAHDGVEGFKTRVMHTKVNGMIVREWCRLLASGNETAIRQALETHLGIREGSAERLLT